MFTSIPQLALLTRDIDGAVVSFADPEDPVYLEFIAWAEAGNLPTIGEYTEPTPVPEVVSPRQMRFALTQLGLRDDFEAAVTASSRNAQDAWEFGLEVFRNEPYLVEVTTSIGWASSDLDNVFILAATL